MAYEGKTIWKNREVENPRTFIMQQNPDGTITLIPAEGTIIEPGTPIIAAIMNNIEDGIKEAHDAIGNINDPTLPAELKGKALTEQTKYVLTNAGKVKSVNSKTGDVVIDIEDISGLNNQSVKIGLNATNVGQGSVAIGREASAAQTAVAIGYQPKAEKMNSIAIGFRVNSLYDSSVAIGTLVSANGIEAVSIGKSTVASEKGIAIGAEVNALASKAIAIGNTAKAEGTSTYSGSVAIGTDTHSMNGYVIGYQSKAIGSHAIAIGSDAQAIEVDSTSIGGNSRATGDYTVALGTSARAEATGGIALGTGARSINSNEGILGGTTSLSPSKWKVPGSFTVNGTKNFEVPHPHPDKKSTHMIRHAAVESPTAGDTLYRYKAAATKESDLITIDLPDYFIHLNKDVQIFVTPQGHFGNGYGVLNREAEQLEIHCQYEGEYNILVIGTRNDDHPSVQEWDIKGVEREIGESWTGETYVFEVDEIIEVEEIKEVA